MLICYSHFRRLYFRPCSISIWFKSNIWWCRIYNKINYCSMSKFICCLNCILSIFGYFITFGIRNWLSIFCKSYFSVCGIFYFWCCFIISFTFFNSFNYRSCLIYFYYIWFCYFSCFSNIIHRCCIYCVNTFFIKYKLFSFC